MPTLPPVLLTVGAFYGTLAAVRCLGRAGVPVTLADGHALAPARWSRYVNHRVSCPDAMLEPEAFVAWLLEFGGRSPRHVLLPTSDDVAWLVAANRAALSAHYDLPPTTLAAVDALLDKRALQDHARAVGLDAPDTWYPTSPKEAVALAEAIGFPLLLKPRTQVLHRSGSKGVIVHKVEDLERDFRALSSPEHWSKRLRELHPDIVWPMLQRFHPTASAGIYSLAGHANRRHEIVAARAARKILQRPRRLGIGLCFEEAEVRAPLLEGLASLAARVGYSGVFEAEFVEADGRALLIDFNPRFYSQMAFDIDRGLALPRLAYADAIRDEATSRALTAEAAANADARSLVYAHRVLLGLTLRAQRLSGKLTEAEARKWWRWWDEHRERASDAVADPGDLAPLVVDLALQLSWFARHPRSYVRSIAFG